MRDELEIPYPNLSGGQGTAYTPRDYRGVAGIDPNTRRMAIIAGAIGGSLLLMMGAWSLTGHRRTGIPVIEADLRPVREKPLNKGGLSVTGADETILSGEAEGKAVVAPAPEAPALRALKATPPAAVVPEPVAAMPAPRTNTVVDAPKPAVAATAPLNVTPMAPAAVAAPAPATPAKPAPVAKTATPVAAQGQVQVQLAALDSQEAATAEWQRLQRKFPDMLSTRSPAMSHIERDGKQFWRLRVGGFVDVAGANSFCNQMRTKGATCVTARF